MANMFEDDVREATRVWTVLFIGPLGSGDRHWVLLAVNVGNLFWALNNNKKKIVSKDPGPLFRL